MRTIALINTDIPPAADSDGRWLSVDGCPYPLPNGQRVRLNRYRDQDTGEMGAELLLRSPGTMLNRHLAATAVIDLTRSAGVRLVPLALECSEKGPERVFVEIQRHGAEVRCWTIGFTGWDGCHHEYEWYGTEDRLRFEVNDIEGRGGHGVSVEDDRGTDALL